MDQTTLDKANTIRRKLDKLAYEFSLFDSERKWVWLHVKDHYGNGSLILKTYHHSELDDASRRLTDFIANAYENFLADVQTELANRINILEEEFKNLKT